MNRKVRAVTLVATATLIGTAAAMPATSYGKTSASSPTSEPTTPNAQQRCPGATLRPNSHDLLAVDDATICLINRVREKRHLRTLTPNEDLDAAAQLHSHEMHIDKFFGHVDPSGQHPRAQILASGYSAHANDVAAGQCVAWGSGRYATPRGTLLDWLASPSHKALLLSPSYDEIGVGAVLGSNTGGPSGALYTADLAQRHLIH